MLEHWIIARSFHLEGLKTLDWASIKHTPSYSMILKIGLLLVWDIVFFMFFAAHISALQLTLHG